MANKNSLYIGSLTSFILDTKPYHSKLTEVQEIYQFYDEMTVHFEEALFTRLMVKAAWPYSYYSPGTAFSVPGVGQPMSLHQLVSPLMRGTASGETTNTSLDNRGAFKAFRDENLDLPLVPFAFDPQQIQGAGLRDAFVQRNGSVILGEPLLEGHDVFLSKGAYVFQIKQTLSTQPIAVGRYNQVWNVSDGPFPVTVALPFGDADSLYITGPAVQQSLLSIEVTGPGAVTVAGLSSLPNYAPTFTERQKENTLAEATANTQALLLDVGNPNSAVNQITAIMSAIAAQLVITPSASASAELALLQTTLATPLLPNSYEALFQALETSSVPVIAGYLNWRGTDTLTDKFVDEALSALSPSLYFNSYTDLRNRESGALSYADVNQAGVSITDIACDPLRPDYEEWTLTANTLGRSFLIRGSTSGSVGSINLPTGTFNSARLGFTFTGPATVPGGTQISLTPRAEITVHYEAPLEAWSIIKTNPRSYSRPVFSSTRYGYLRSLTNEVNYITILDIGMPKTSLVLTAITSTTFTLTSSAESLYTPTITIGTPFNDGRLAFTIVAGSAYAFTVGDKFYVDIENPEPLAEDLDLYYGYDMDSFDADTMVYNNINSLLADYLEPIRFGYDSRFIGYDVSSFGLVLQPYVVPNRRWRLRAIANTSMPVNLHPVTAPATMVNQVSVIATIDPENPTAPIQIDMVNDVTSEGPHSGNDPAVTADLVLWYATSFDLEYYDEGTTAWILVDNIAINAPYTNAVHGLAFTVVQASKPFIAAELTSSWYSEVGGVLNVETVHGGDTIAWTTLNEPPFQTEAASLSNRRVPRLIMYGDSYHFSTPAKWTLAFTAPGVYTVQGVYTTGPQNGQQVYVTAPTVSITANGNSYKNDVHGLHFTVVEGVAGVAPSDVFTFDTFERKPSYLVHGSVSGWQPDAEVGRWYWNGKIGFKIAAARAYLFDSNNLQLGAESSWVTPLGIAYVNYLRPDTPTSEYKIVSHVDGHWTMYRRGAVVGEGEFVVSDKYLSVTMPAAVQGENFIVSIQGQERPLTLGHDLAIVRTTASRTPTADDFILLERTTSDTLSISITPKDPAHSVALLPLAPVNITHVDHFAMNGLGSAGEVPLSVTSPETAILQGWFPVLETRYDRTLSIAEFSDPQVRVVVRAAGTGETVGEVLSLSTNPAEPVIFRWDPTFHDKYLPINSEANIVTLGGGWNDRVNVNMTDNAVFLIAGGGLLDDVLFADVANVSIVDESFLSILSNYAESTDVVISDGPFAGFLPGYDNMRMDYETGSGDMDDENAPSGYYDAGVPLSDWFQQAQGLSLLQVRQVLTAPQQALLNDLLGLIGPWLDGDILTTTFAEFVVNIGANPPDPALYTNALNWTPVSEFGIPVIGMGVQIETQSTNSASTSIRESASILVNEFGYSFDQTGYDLGEMDLPAEREVVLFSQDLPPLPIGGLGGLTTYAAFDAALYVPAPGARVVEIAFTDPVLSTPAFHLWRPTDAAPSVVPIVERLSDRRFRFSLPTATELKVIVV